MGRNTKTKYGRTGTIKVRSSVEHIKLLTDIRWSFESYKPSEADIISWALEEYAIKHCKNKIKFIPNTRIDLKKKMHGKTIEIGKHY